MKESVSTLLRRGLEFKQRVSWGHRRWSPPGPPAVKRAVLSRYGAGSACWIETGTFHGDTTAYLSSLGSSVKSIEPDTSLYLAALRRLAKYRNIELLSGTSEKLFEECLLASGSSVACWLDGHWSGGTTYLGDQQTSIRHELDVLAKHVAQFESLVVFVDDIREFDGSLRTGYPHRTELVTWASTSGMDWTIEHDIFIAWKTGAS